MNTAELPQSDAVLRLLIIFYGLVGVMVSLLGAVKRGDAPFSSKSVCLYSGLVDSDAGDDGRRKTARYAGEQDMRHTHHLQS